MSDLEVEIVENDIEVEILDVPIDITIDEEVTEVVVEGAQGPSAPAPEAWHYVDDPDEPVFLNGWHNVGFSNPAFAFRNRGGIIDVAGIILGGSSAEITTFPIGYRPSAITPLLGGGTSDFTTTMSVMMVIYPDGRLGVVWPTTMPTVITIAGIFFVDSPRAVP